MPGYLGCVSGVSLSPLAAFGIAAGQAGLTAVHQHHGFGVALEAQGGRIGVVTRALLCRRFWLAFVARLNFGSFLIKHQLLLLAKLVGLNQADALEMVLEIGRAS